MNVYLPMLVARRGLGQASSQVQTIAQAIAKAEGYQPGSNNIPTSHNNPGDIKSGNTIIQYATPQDGWNALYNQVNLMITGQSAYYNPNMTWAQIGAYYDNPTASNWATNVAATLGVSPNSTLGDYLSGSAGGSAQVAVNPVSLPTSPSAGSTDSPDATGTDTTTTGLDLSGIDWTWLAWGGGVVVLVLLLSSPKVSYA